MLKYQFSRVAAGGLAMIVLATACETSSRKSVSTYDYHGPARTTGDGAPRETVREQEISDSEMVAPGEMQSPGEMRSPGQPVVSPDRKP